jgi:hypothetical protein
MKIRKTKKLSKKEVARLKIEHKSSWLTCSVTGCTEEVLVDENVVAVKCSICTIKMVPGPARKKEKSAKPAGWRFMAEFVDADGNVFYFGEEQPKLKGTKKLSDVEKIRAQQKTKREETKKKKELREKLKQERLAKQHEKAKKAKKKASDKKQKAIDKLNGKETKKTKKKNTNSVFRYEKFEEPRIASDRTGIQEFIESESIFAEHLQRREIDITTISKIARSSYAKIDTVTGDVKSKRRGYKVSLETGDVKIVNITVK